MKRSNPDLLFQLLDQDPLISTAALRLLEPAAKRDEKVRAKLSKELLKGWEKAPVELILQMALTAGVLDQKASHQLLAGILERHGTSSLIRDATLSSLQDGEFAFLQTLLQSPQWQTHGSDKEIFLEMLTTSIIRKRDPAELTALLAILDVGKSFGWREKAVLTGMSTQGINGNLKPVRLASAPGILSRSDAGMAQARLGALASLFEWPGHAAETSLQRRNPLNEEEQRQFALGRQHYLSTCAGCHGTDGAGLNRFAPPLIGSDWVLGDEKRLALIVLHGIEGPLEVNGKAYNAPDVLPVMPAHSTMDDAAITAILTYIRNEWGNEAGPVGKGVVGKTRITSQGRVVPWTAAALNQYILDPTAGGK